MWDDHELDDNGADETPEHPERGLRQRRAAAFRAYYGAADDPARSITGAEQERWLLDGFRAVLTGDVHAHWASDLELDYDDPDSPTVGSELVCSSVTSGEHGSDEPARSHPWMANNPHLRFHDDLRDYVRTTITPSKLTADFRCVEKVSAEGAAAFTRATFVVHAGAPGLHQTHDRGPVASGVHEWRTPSSARTIRSETLRP